MIVALAMTVLMLLSMASVVYAFFARDIGSKITLYSTYDFIGPRQPAILFFIDYLAIMDLNIEGSAL